MTRAASGKCSVRALANETETKYTATFDQILPYFQPFFGDRNSYLLENL